MVKMQSKLTLIGVHESYEKYDSFTFKQNEVLMDEPINLGFSVLDLSKLLMCETYCDKRQPYFGEYNIELHYMDTESFVISIKSKDVIKDLYNTSDSFDFSNSNKENKLFNNKNKKVVGKFEIERKIG